MNTIGIVGGGPAGAMAAAKLSSGDLHVTVFEEKLVWEKPCGGGLPARAVRRYPFLLEASCPFKQVREAELIDPRGTSVRFRLREPLLIYSRRELNQLLLQRAKQAGAEIVEDRILSFERRSAGWQLESQHGAYRADYLVLAAGARSRLRSKLAHDFGPRDFMLTFGYYVPVQDDLLRLQFFEDYEGYAWAFPRLDHLSVGICGKMSGERMPALRDRLHGFIKRFGYPADSAAAYSHLLPSLSVEAWSNLRLSGDGWALVGDAAGLVDPVTGEGVYYAMRSGTLLAESLLAGSPELYRGRVFEEFGDGMTLGARLAPYFYRGEFLGASPSTRLVELAAHSPAFMELLQDLLAGSQSYAGLAARLYRILPRAAIETATALLGEALGRPSLAAV